MSKIILGFTGLMASGKDVAKKYLEEKYGSENFRFSTIMRDVLGRLNLDVSRENLQAVSLCLRQTFGEDLFAKVIANDAKNAQSDIVVIDGVRRLADIAHLTELEGFHLIAIDADPHVRYERMVKRGENVGDADKSFEQFIKDGEQEAELKIPEVMASADITLNNDGDLENLYEQIDKIVAKIQNN